MIAWLKRLWRAVVVIVTTPLWGIISLVTLLALLVMTIAFYFLGWFALALFSGACTYVALFLFAVYARGGFS